MAGQAVAHGAGHREGRRPGARRRATGHAGQNLVAPHLRVPRGREAVQEPGVSPSGPGLQRLGCLHHRHVEHGVQSGQVQPMESACAGPGGGEEAGEIGQLRPGVEGAEHLRARHRIGLDGEDVQALAGVVMASPQIEQGQDVQAGPQAQLGDGEARTARPGVRQAAASQEHLAGLGQTIGRGEIDIVETAGTRRPVRAPVDDRLVDHPSHPGLCANEKGPPEGDPFHVQIRTRLIGPRTPERRPRRRRWPKPRRSKRLQKRRRRRSKRRRRRQKRRRRRKQRRLPERAWACRRRRRGPRSRRRRP